MKVVNIQGVTGSIGNSALDIIRQNKDKYEIGSIIGGSNWQELAKIANEFSPKIVCIVNDAHLSDLRNAIGNSQITVVSGNVGLEEAASYKADITLSAISGFAALKPTMLAIRNSKVLALANKESIVCAGEFILREAEQFNCKLIPVDSEHNALFQVFESGNKAAIDKLYITASGGALRDYSIEQLSTVTPEIATSHPNWQMGAKITVDCATLANKGLEFIEACVLFGVSKDMVDVLVHRQSIIHALIEYSDGSTLAQLASPDMKSPIIYAFEHPNRGRYNYKKLDLTQTAQLTFEKPDYVRFPLLKTAMDVMGESLSHRIVFNAANEVAVNKFLSGEISYLDIQNSVMKTLESFSAIGINNISEVFELDSQIRG